jgi:bifunctional non-homologous end joining protein LigD
MPDFVSPDLPSLVSNPPPGGGWAHEIKFDGYRMQMRVRAARRCCAAAQGLDWTHRFPEIAADARLARLPGGRGDRGAGRQGDAELPGLTTALSTGKTAGSVFYVFDLLFQEGLDLRELPLTERKQRLRDDGPLEARGAAALRRPLHHPGRAVLQSACRMDLEGIVSKRVEAPYRSGAGEAGSRPSAAAARRS